MMTEFLFLAELIPLKSSVWDNRSTAGRFDGVKEIHSVSRRLLRQKWWEEEETLTKSRWWVEVLTHTRAVGTECHLRKLFLRLHLKTLLELMESASSRTSLYCNCAAIKWVKQWIAREKEREGLKARAKERKRG